MKYLWIAILLVFELVWIVFSIKDIRYCNQIFSKPYEHYEIYTQLFFLVHILVPIILLFIYSMWLWIGE